jgi:protein ImuB
MPPRFEPWSLDAVKLRLVSSAPLTEPFKPVTINTRTKGERTFLENIFMYACLSAPGVSAHLLQELAYRFSPVAELLPDPAGFSAVFSIAGLGRLMGGPQQIASEIARRADQMGIRGQLAIAANPDAAALAAHHFAGVTILPIGREAEVLGGLPIRALAHQAQPDTLRTLEHWGVRTLADLAALPGLGLIERFGQEGARLRQLALGQTTRPLGIPKDQPDFSAAEELDQEIRLLEPLLFVLNKLLSQALARVLACGFATNQVTLVLGLVNAPPDTRKLEFPIPITEAAALLKQLQLELEAHPFHRAVCRAEITLRPTPKRARQNGFFTPPTPEPEKLQTVLARLSALVGAENVGSPELLDTHRPDAYQMLPFRPEDSPRQQEATATPTSQPRLAFRRYRPVMPARVRLEQSRPVRVETATAGGRVEQAAGPWKSSGDWWGDQRWSREEWDVALSDGGLYRLYQAWGNWFLEGEYD